jgi:hypothetical protein
MEPSVNVDEVMLRAARYWMEDGLVEILLGLQMVLMFGGVLAAGGVHAGPFVMMAMMFVAPTLCMWGFKKLKERITFPRCGYVGFPKPRRTYRNLVMVMAFGFVVSEALIILKFGQEEWLSRMAMPAFAIVFAACLLGGGFQYKQPSMLWEGFLTLLIAAFLTWFTNLHGWNELIVLMVTVGASMAIIGAVRLWSFLRANPKPRETEA